MNRVVASLKKTECLYTDSALIYSATNLRVVKMADVPKYRTFIAGQSQ